MTREEYLKKLILENYPTVKEFALKIDMPYTTLHSILKNVGGAAVDKVIKICNGLGISADDLARYEDGASYYKNKDASDFAEYLRTRPGARMLFSASQDITKEEMEETVKYIEFLKSKRK